MLFELIFLLARWGGFHGVLWRRRLLLSFVLFVVWLLLSSCLFVFSERVGGFDQILRRVVLLLVSFSVVFSL